MKAIIKRALSEDAKFLSSHLIIDYSLLVGVDADRQEIVVGIIGMKISVLHLTST